MRLPTCSTTARVPSTASTRRSSSTRPCWTSSINPIPQFNKSVLHLVLDSATRKSSKLVKTIESYLYCIGKFIVGMGEKVSIPHLSKPKFRIVSTVRQCHISPAEGTLPLQSGDKSSHG